jgi:hypothetical protein
MAYTCDRCGRSFTASQGSTLRLSPICKRCHAEEKREKREERLLELQEQRARAERSSSGGSPFWFRVNEWVTHYIIIPVMMVVAVLVIIFMIVGLIYTYVL